MLRAAVEALVHLRDTNRGALSTQRMLRSLSLRAPISGRATFIRGRRRPLASESLSLRLRTFATLTNLPSSRRLPPNMTVHGSNGDERLDYGNFKLLQSFDIKYAPVTISKWRSEKTGLTVVLGSHASPIVSLHHVWIIKLIVW
jgi:hypothetical protein